MSYQSHAQRLAPLRTSTEEFQSGLAFVARRMLFAVPSLTSAERQLLWDLSRSESRYAMKALQTLITIAPRCPKVDDQEALPEFIRGRIVAQRESADVFTAFAAETEAQGLADLAQFKYARRQNDITRLEVIEALRRQQAATRWSLDVLLSAA